MRTKTMDNTPAAVISIGIFLVILLLGSLVLGSHWVEPQPSAPICREGFAVIHVNPSAPDRYRVRCQPL